VRGLGALRGHVLLFSLSLARPRARKNEVCAECAEPLRTDVPGALIMHEQYHFYTLPNFRTLLDFTRPSPTNFALHP
jgi:hypothetical protein